MHMSRNLAVLLLLVVSPAVVAQEKLDVTFIVTGDTHITAIKPDDPLIEAKNHVKAMNLLRMNAGRRLEWPAGLEKAGQEIPKPAAVFVAGDLSYDDNLTGCGGEESPSLKAFSRLYVGKGRLLEAHAYLDAGNHDVQAHIIRYPVQKNTGNNCVSTLIRETFDDRVVSKFTASHGGQSWFPPHYAVRLGQGGRLLVVNLNTSLAEPCRSVVGFGENTHGYYVEPTEKSCDAFSWLKTTLDTHVTAYGSNAPIIIVQHYGYDGWGTNQDSYAYRGYWWAPDTRQKFTDLIAKYHVVALLNGHTHQFDRVAPKTEVRGVAWGGERKSEIFDLGYDNGGRGWANVNPDPKTNRDLSFCRVLDVTGGAGVRCTSPEANPSLDIVSAAMNVGDPKGRGWADVNGDGRADFCRLIGGSTGNRPIMCRLTTAAGFGSDTKPVVVDVGWEAGRAWVDANGDGRADFCRVVGSKGDRVRCALAKPDGTFLDEWESPPIDSGYDAGRAWVDVDGDKKLDFCRVVKYGGKMILRCATSQKDGKPVTPLSASIESAIEDAGYDEGRGWADINGDGKADFCRVMKANTAIGQIGCVLSTGTKFEGNVDSLTDAKGGGLGYNVGFTAGRTWADFNGDGRADFCRVVEGNGGERGRVECTTAGINDKKQSYWVSGIRSLPLDPGYTQGRAFVDADGDGKIDYCRLVDGNGSRGRAVCTLAQEFRTVVPVNAFTVGWGSCGEGGGFDVVRVTDDRVEVVEVTKKHSCVEGYPGLVDYNRGPDGNPRAYVVNTKP